MKKIQFEIVVTDKNTSNIVTRNIEVGTREEFNTQVEEFLKTISFIKWSYEIIPEDYLTDEEVSIVQNHKDNCYLLFNP